ncbi:MAG TPA: hypothetical protein VL360_08665 [Gammaproteobacteria bacterium]|jgi:hypothetical protein|nr:hypothetical protein [Gammaproteobacteria bacterium]
MQIRGNPVAKDKEEMLQTTEQVEGFAHADFSTREELARLLQDADDIATRMLENSETASNGIEELVPVNTPQPRSCAVRVIHIKRAAYSFPFGAALCEAAETAIDLSNQPLAIIIPATICNFGAALSINSKYNHEGIEDAFNVIEQRNIPADWPKLSKAKEITAATASIVMGSWAAFADSVLAYYFVNELREKYVFLNKNFSAPLWQAASDVTAAAVFLNITSGEGMATWKKVREVMAGVKPKYSNRASRYLTPTIGYTIAIFGSFNDGVMTCTGLYDVFEITSLAPRIITGAACSSIAFTDYFMNGAFVIECLDIFFGSFTPAEGETPAYKDSKIVSAFALSLLAGGLLAYTYHGITKEMMLELLETLGIDYASVTDPIIETLAYVGAASFFINSAGSVFPIFYKGVEVSQTAASAVSNALSSILDSVYNCCYGAKVRDFLDLSEDETANLFNDEDFEVVVEGGDEYTYNSAEAKRRKERLLYNLFTPQKEPDVQPGSHPQNSPRK